MQDNIKNHYFLQNF